MTRALLVISALSAVVGAIATTGCRGGQMEEAYVTYTGGYAPRGHAAILNHNCGSCHTIPGVRGAFGMVGPPLLAFGRRTYIAGRLPNNPENLERWLRNPQQVEPGTAMPDLGLGKGEARDVAAYLYTLR